MTNRKRSKKVEAKVDKKEVGALNQNEMQLIQAVAEGSKKYLELQQQYNKYNMIKKQVEAKRLGVQKGQISLPILIGLSQNMLYQENDKKAVLKMFDEQLKQLNVSLKGINGQMQQYKDIYVEIGLRLLSALDNKFGAFKVKNIINDLKVSPSKDEEVLFEDEFENIAKDPKEFKAAKAKAVKLNKGRK